MNTWYLQTFIPIQRVVRFANLRAVHYHRKNGWLQLMPSNNRLLLIFSNYDFSLLSIPVLQKYSKFERMFGCICSLFCYSSNGWLQLELRINSIPLKKGMTPSACFKETQHPGKY